MTHFLTFSPHPQQAKAPRPQKAEAPHMQQAEVPTPWQAETQTHNRPRHSLPSPQSRPRPLPHRGLRPPHYSRPRTLGCDP